MKENYIQEEIINVGLECKGKRSREDMTVKSDSNVYHTLIFVSRKWKIVGSSGSMLGPVLFRVFINDLDARLEGIVSQFADDSSCWLPQG